MNSHLRKNLGTLPTEFFAPAQGTLALVTVSAAALALALVLEAVGETGPRVMASMVSETGGRAASIATMFACGASAGCCSGVCVPLRGRFCGGLTGNLSP